MLQIQTIAIVSDTHSVLIKQQTSMRNSLCSPNCKLRHVYVKQPLQMVTMAPPHTQEALGTPSNVIFHKTAFKA